MPSRLVFCTLLAAAAGAAPCAAQSSLRNAAKHESKIVSNFPPLSPSEAVRVLRSSHSPADMANRPAIDTDGPRIYVLPYDPSIDAPPPMTPPDPLARDLMYPLPYDGVVGGLPYLPYGGFVASPRPHWRDGTRRSGAHATLAPAPTRSAAPPAPRGRSVAGAPPKAAGVRR
jgi:hypothetical protein